MLLFRKIIDFYIFSNIHVALASASLTKLTLLFWENNTNLIPLFVFFSTIVSYNYIRLFRDRTKESWFTDWLNGNKLNLLILSSLSLAALVVLFFKLKLDAVLVLLPFGLLTFLYIAPPFLSIIKGLRKWPMFKIFAIAISWAGITVLFPLTQYGIFNIEVGWQFLRQFLFVLALTLPFDIRDVTYDATSLKTIPGFFGIKKAKILGYLLLLGFITVSLEFLNDSLIQHLISIFIAVLLGILLFKAIVNQNKYYCAFWVESLPILWLGLYLASDIYV